MELLKFIAHESKLQCMDRQSSSLIFSGVHVAQSLVCSVIIVCPSVLSLLLILLSVLLQFTASYYSFGICKPFIIQILV